jgi:hypothetical protein
VPKAWYEKIDNYLKQQGLVRSSIDHNLYYMCEVEKVVILVIYVDDLFLTRNHTKRIEWFTG